LFWGDDFSDNENGATSSASSAESGFSSSASNANLFSPPTPSNEASSDTLLSESPIQPLLHQHQQQQQQQQQQQLPQVSKQPEPQQLSSSAKAIEKHFVEARKGRHTGTFYLRLPMESNSPLDVVPLRLNTGAVYSLASQFIMQSPPVARSSPSRDSLAQQQMGDLIGFTVFIKKLLPSDFAEVVMTSSGSTSSIPTIKSQSTFANPQPSNNAGESGTQSPTASQSNAQASPQAQQLLQYQIANNTMETVPLTKSSASVPVQPATSGNSPESEYNYSFSSDSSNASQTPRINITPEEAEAEQEYEDEEDDEKLYQLDEAQDQRSEDSSNSNSKSDISNNVIINNAEDSSSNDSGSTSSSLPPTISIEGSEPHPNEQFWKTTPTNLLLPTMYPKRPAMPLVKSDSEVPTMASKNPPSPDSPEANIASRQSLGSYRYSSFFSLSSQL